MTAGGVRSRPLVGRDREISEVSKSVASVPLTTVTGPGGVGKTALALAVVGPVAAGKKPPAPSGDKTPPTAPTNLHVTSLGQTSVTLAWGASTDNSGSFSYSVNKDGQGFTVEQGQTSFTIDWLSAEVKA